jgi:hypothetical protein
MISPDEYPDILVTVAHPFGDVNVPLETWIERGPGPRPFVGIVAAKRKTTGEPVPMAEIPLEYHNSAKSRDLQRKGQLRCPWGPPPDHEPKPFGSR